MAGEFSLGPSDAPCSGKTSTAHDGYLLWVMLLQTGKILAPDSAASAPDQAHHLFTINPFTPEIRFSPQISLTSPASRRASIAIWSAIAKLGFCLAGLESNVGPLLLQKPKSTTSTSLQNEFKPRSVTSSVLSTCRKCLDRFLNLNGRRLHLREDSPRLLWFYIHILRILALDLYVAKTYESKNLVMYDVLFPTPTCRMDGFGYRISMPKYSALITFSKDFKHRSNLNTSSLQIWYYLLLCALEHVSPDFETVVIKSLIDALLCLQSLVPARNMSLAPSSTSPRLLTGTIVPSIDSFMAARSTNRDLTCTQTLSSFGFTALMDLMSISFSYLFMALGNVLLCNVRNFRVSGSLFSLYLTSFE